MKSLILLLILAFAQPAQAQMSCMDLFNHSRPTDEQINTAIFDLKYLLSEQYSKDPTIAAFAKTESQKKFIELQRYITLAEIKAKLQNMTLSSPSSLSAKRNKLKKSGEELLENLSLNEFLKIYKFESIHSKDTDGTTSLMYAASNGLNNIVKILIQRGLDVNAQNRTGHSALTIAVIYKHKDIVETLLNNKAEVNSLDTENSTPLMHSSEKGFKEISKLLIQHGADVNAKNTSDYTALIFASLNGRDDVAELLIQNGADINAQTNSGLTALMQAADQGHTKTVEILLQNKADFTMKNIGGKTALMFADWLHHEGAIKALRKAGAAK